MSDAEVDEDEWDALATELFALYDVHTRAVYLRAGNPKKRNALLQFARLLAAYYLDFGVPSADGAQLPNLFHWSENCRPHAVDGAFERAFPRASLAAMPTELTPGAVVRLLCAVGAWLEALFFVDHFDDFRAQILLRRVLDVNFGLNLFSEHCERHLSAVLLERLCDDAASTESDELMRRHVDVLLQLDVVFGSTFIARLKRDVQCRIDAELAQLQDDDVDRRVGLPRPPIYAEPSQPNDEGLAELHAWNTIHRLIHLLLSCLASANRLEPLTAGVVVWILRARQMTADGCGDIDESELPYIIEAELADDDELDEDQRLFARLLFCVLQMSLRDRISLFWRRHGDDSRLADVADNTAHAEFVLLERKYAALFASGSSADDADSNRDSGRFEDSEDISVACERTSPQRLLRRWMHTAMDEDDVTQLFNFIQFAKAAHPQRERYLPVLNGSSTVKWRATLLSQLPMIRQVDRSCSRDDELACLQDEDKITVDALEMSRLRFIANALPTIPRLDDASLIGIALRLRADSFARSDELPTTSANFLSSNQEAEPSTVSDNTGSEAEEVIGELKTPNDTLLAQIRASIRRLGNMRDTLTQPRLIKVDQEDRFEDLLTNFQLEKLKVEISALKEIIGAPGTSRAAKIDSMPPVTARSLPAKLNAVGQNCTIKNRTVDGKIKIKKYSDYHNTVKDKSAAFENNETVGKPSPGRLDASPYSSGRYSDVSSRSLMLSSARLHAEIEEIGQRLSRLRDDLRAPTLSMAPITTVPELSGNESDDSALALSAHGVAPLDLSALHSSSDERVDVPPPAWTDITVYPRPRHAKKVKRIIKSPEEPLPSWLLLLPPNSRGKHSSDKQRTKKNAKTHYGTRPLLQLSHHDRAASKNFEIARKSNDSNYDEQLAKTASVKQLQYDTPVLFASDMTREEIDALLQRAKQT